MMPSGSIGRRSQTLNASHDRSIRACCHAIWAAAMSAWILSLGLPVLPRFGYQRVDLGGVAMAEELAGETGAALYLLGAELFIVPRGRNAGRDGARGLL